MTTLYLVNDVAGSRPYRILEPQLLERILVSSSIKIHCSAWALTLFVTERRSGHGRLYNNNNNNNNRPRPQYLVTTGDISPKTKNKVLFCNYSIARGKKPKLSMAGCYALGFHPPRMSVASSWHPGLCKHEQFLTPKVLLT